MNRHLFVLLVLLFAGCHPSASVIAPPVGQELAAPEIQEGETLIDFRKFGAGESKEYAVAVASNVWVGFRNQSYEFQGGEEDPFNSAWPELEEVVDSNDFDKNISSPAGAGLEMQPSNGVVKLRVTNPSERKRWIVVYYEPSAD